MYHQRLSLGWTGRALRFAILAALLVLGGCTDTGKISAEHAKEHVKFLLKEANQDIEQIQKGLPKGAKILAQTFDEGEPMDAQKSSEALERARGKTYELRLAKSTFFALVEPDGKVIRNDQEQDRMAGKNMFASYKELKKVAQGKTVETRGSMPEAAGVRGKPDAQWVVGVPVVSKGEVAALYVSGWSWSAYAYRLETALRSDILSSTKEGGKVPLTYVYVIVGNQAFGAPISPTVNAEAILKQKPLGRAAVGEPFSVALEIENRQFGLAVVPLEKLGKDVGIAVLRSET
jgi:hypothetical protein